MYIKPILIGIYAIAFILFEISYFNTDFTKTYTFEDNIENVIKYTKNIEADNIYFEYAIKEPAIYVCFYNEINTYEYVRTVKFRDDHKSFDSVIEFCNYKFYLPKQLNEREKNCYVMKKKTEEKYDINRNIWKITYIDDFAIIEKI